MINTRYELGKFAGIKHITDYNSGRVFAYGYGIELPTYQQHRMFYTDDDARAIIEWLNFSSYLDQCIKLHTRAP